MDLMPGERQVWKKAGLLRVTPVPANDMMDFSVCLLILFYYWHAHQSLRKRIQTRNRIPAPWQPAHYFGEFVSVALSGAISIYPHSIKGLSFVSLGNCITLILTLTEVLCFVP